jgi:hypothetical protein
LADETPPKHYKKKAPKERERKPNNGGKDQSPGKVWLIVYWPTMMLSLLVQHSEKFFLMYSEGTIIIMFVNFSH